MIVRFSDNEIETMQAALDKWGLDAQCDQAIEECAELIVALQKHVKRTPQPGTFDAVTDEIADVEIHDFRFAKTPFGRRFLSVSDACANAARFRNKRRPIPQTDRE